MEYAANLMHLRIAMNISVRNKWEFGLKGIKGVRISEGPLYC